MKSNIYVLDTSAVSAFLIKNDAFHEEAKKIFAEIPVDALIVMPIMVLIELEARTKHVPSWKSLLENKLPKIIDEIQEIDITFLEALRVLDDKLLTKLKAVDLTVLITALTRDAYLITFDEKLASASRLWGIDAELTARLKTA